MNEALNNLTAAILCGRVVEAENCKALSVAQWHKLVVDLNDAGYKEPCCLLELELEQIAAVKGVTHELANRIFKLINYRYVVEDKIEKLSAMGVEMVGMDNENYPNALVSGLNTIAPPILFCLGNTKLLNKKGIGVTGSRNPDDTAVCFARYMGKKAAKEGYVVISGGALGCDTISECNATANGGEAVLYMATPIEQSLNNARIKALVQKGKICLVWDHNPHEAFTAYGALSRNKYIYAAAEKSVVVASTKGKGGSFKGASECLGKGIGKIYAYKNGWDGNTELINMGALPIDQTAEPFQNL